MSTDPAQLARGVVWLAVVGAIVLFGSRLAASAARKARV